jgi:hypothetical protein
MLNLLQPPLLVESGRLKVESEKVGELFAPYWQISLRLIVAFRSLCHVFGDGEGILGKRKEG